MVKLLQEKFRLGIVDADAGQSHLGPPTTIAWAKIKEEFTAWQNLEVEDFRFVGTLSPTGNTKRVLEAVDYIFKKASAECDKVIIDTCGYVQGFEAARFKTMMIRLLQPDLVIALERLDELEPILKETKPDGFAICRVIVPAEIKTKTPAERAAYRQNLFQNYFTSARQTAIPVRLLKRWDSAEEDLVNKIVSLRNSSDEDVALGLITKKQFKDVHVLTPGEKMEQITSVVVGKYQWQNH